MKKLAFVTCSNGYGHFKRILEVAKELIDFYEVTIYCEPYQLSKFNPTLNVTFIHPPYENIRWDKIVANRKENYREYKKWLDWIGPNLLQYDIVVSDNVLGVLKYRTDTIIMGSFFWHEIIREKIPNSKIAKIELDLLIQHKPVILTNKHVEIGSVKDYINKVQAGFGFKQYVNSSNREDTFIAAIRPSLDYSKGYTNFFNNFIQEYKDYFNIHGNIDDSRSSLYVVRPGVGIITHCIEHRVPMLCLYDPSDSVEIRQLAFKVEELGFGLAHNILTPLTREKIQAAKLKDIYIEEVEKNGYSKKASYLKSL